MSVIVFFVLFFAGVITLTLLLPVKVYMWASGGSGSRFQTHLKVMVLYGLFGGGLLYSGERYRMQALLLSRRLFTIDITRIVLFIARKAKKRPIREKKETKRKKPLNDRITSVFRKRKTYEKYIKETYRIVPAILRFEHCSVNVTLGLGDPMITGCVAGIIYAFKELLPESCVITPRWDFSSNVIRGDCSLYITVMSFHLWKTAIQYLIRYFLKKDSNTHSALITQEV